MPNPTPNPSRKPSIALFSCALGGALLLHGAHAASASGPTRGAEATQAVAESVHDRAVDGKIEGRRTAHARWTPAIRKAVADDPRSQPLLQQWKAASKLANKAARARALAVLAPKIESLRAELLTKAGVKIADLAVALPRVPSILAGPPVSGDLLSKVEITSFPGSYKYKKSCPDEEDTWDFDGDNVTVFASSAVGDDDCMTIRAGRKGKAIAVPSGARTMKVEIYGHADYAVTAASLGAWAGAWSYLAARVEFPGGSGYDTVENPLGGPDIVVRHRQNELFWVGADHDAPEGLLFPASWDTFEDTLSPGDANTSTTFGLPEDPGATVIVTPVVGGKVDADLTGYSEMDSEFEPSKIVVSFYL